jgi:CubicO group peptidase (beta-lactamase class C family)
LFVATILLASQQIAVAQDHAAKIQELLALAHKYRQFNGTALVAENGKVVYKGAFGSANMEWNIPNTPDTKFRLGSITKQFTATVILQLVEQGKIKLDAKLTDYLPDYRKDTGDNRADHLQPTLRAAEDFDRSSAREDDRGEGNRSRRRAISRTESETGGDV